jgi:hypothetical protein
MAAKHGTRRRYIEGCRCEGCTEANRLYFRERRAGVRGSQLRVQPPADLQEVNPGPVESGVMAEIDSLAAQARPGLAQVALSLARIMDDPRAINQKAAAAKVLVSLLDKLRTASAQRRRGGLAVVRTMTKKGGA